jgi:hypothetical protein
VENIQPCRAMGSMFRQFAMFDPVHSWKYLIEAQKWEHLAEAEIASHFKECNTADSMASELRPTEVKRIALKYGQEFRKAVSPTSEDAGGRPIRAIQSLYRRAQGTLPES